MSIFSPCFSCGVKVGDYIYSSAYRCNALVKIDIETGKTRCIGRFDEEKILIENQHSRAYMYSDKIYFCPAMGNKIHIFDVLTSQITAVDIGRNEYSGEYYGIFNEGKIILCPKKPGGNILCFDIDTMSITSLVCWGSLEPYFTENMKNAFLRILNKENVLYLPIYDTNSILKIDIDTCAIKNEKVNCNRMLGVFDTGSKITVANTDGTVFYKWNGTGNQELTSIHMESMRGNANFTYVKKLNDVSYYFPGSASGIIGIEKNDILEPVLHFKNDMKKLLFSEPFLSENNIWALPFDGNQLVCISNNNIKKIELTEIEFEENERELLINEIVNLDNNLMDEEMLSLEEFIIGVKKRG